MTLNQTAKQAMDYLDSVGVAADWGELDDAIIVYTDNHYFLVVPSTNWHPLAHIKSTYPQKSPA